MNGAPDPILKSPSGRPLSLFVDIDWSGDVAAKLISASFRMNDFGPLLRAIARKVVGTTQRRFFEQRSPDGQAWAPLKKPRGRGHNPSSRALFDSGKLFESITYEELGADAVAVGFTHDAFYGKFHQDGTRHIPARPFLGIGPDDLPTMAEMLRGHVTNAFEAAA